MARPVQVSITVNGVSHAEEVEPRLLLVHFLRETLGLTGTHVGCDTSSCGACTVHLDGRAVKSCTVLAVQADGAEVTTIEGLARNGELHPVQRALLDNFGFQCGFCTPGFAMTIAELVAERPGMDADEAREALVGNICRCTGYVRIVASLLDAAGRAQGSGARDAG